MGDAGSEDELPDFTPNIYKVVRELKREDHRAYNCLASIVQDAAFVRAVAAAYPAFARFANLRCGVWYAGAGRGSPRPTSTTSASPRTGRATSSPPTATATTGASAP